MKGKTEELLEDIIDINIITEKHYKGKNIEKIIALCTPDRGFIPITCKGLLQNNTEKIIPFCVCVCVFKGQKTHFTKEEVQLASKHE